ncbi:dihydrodipicolinate synthase family protein [Methylobrevis pamukkalensis]|uniref:4-hydroxy-tetrahydrodipicolinate synthase n=1 Tax=Methylobrevis pamukkalensis TaxID=1439726 RepID=A0A1E3H3I2_9HYPH|nr:dihydrodipicolinate synthase family protein [Methylobrevis pamukkalensis]ODN70872.1 4-hydroxy-tetrahydrodipicolinate synthase [Methylobrevis pamukkalensis]
MRKALPFVALVTCFSPDEAVDFGAIRRQAARQAAAGNNILACGTNGDFTALTFAEKVTVTETIVDAVAGRVKVWVNVGTPSTFETILLARECQKTGVDALSVIAPYFIPCTQEGLADHFTRVADAVDKPVYLYDIPARTQNHIAPETCARLADHPNILGIKDSGGGRDTLEAYLAVARGRDDFDVFSGPDSLVLHGLQNGSGGCISGLANAMPGAPPAICRAFAAGDMAAAEAAQARFTALRADLYGLGYPPAMTKRALYLMDPSVGASRAPALLPTEELDAKISAVIAAHGLSA